MQVTCVNHENPKCSVFGKCDICGYQGGFAEDFCVGTLCGSASSPHVSRDHRTVLHLQGHVA